MVDSNARSERQVGAMIQSRLAVQVSEDKTTLTIFEIDENPHPFRLAAYGILKFDFYVVARLQLLLRI